VRVRTLGALYNGLFSWFDANVSMTTARLVPITRSGREQMASEDHFCVPEQLDPSKRWWTPIWKTNLEEGRERERVDG
jgi:hypothetical protein